MFKVSSIRIPNLRYVLHRLNANTTFSEECKITILRQRMEEICGVMHSPTGNFHGITLTGAVGQAAIAAIERPLTCSIVTVPVDTREYCRRVLKHSLNKPGVEGRRDLLCSAALPGSGKTVLLSFNAYWFVKKTKGIAVEITFNGDQSNLYTGHQVRSAYELEIAVSIRIMHRIISKFRTGKTNADTECRIDGSITKALMQLKDPLGSTLGVLRSILGASCETRILICIDELGKWINIDGSNFSNVDALKVLTERLDSDESLFLALSALGANDLVNLSTDSNRHLLLQTLGPLWFPEGFDPDMIHLLPEVLQPFYREDSRLLLPCHATALQLYDDLAQLLATAAGHPRRLEVLFRELGKFRSQRSVTEVLLNASSTRAERCAAGRQFVASVTDWLRQTEKDGFGATELKRLAKAVASIVLLPIDYSRLICMSWGEIVSLPAKQKEALSAAAIEELALYSAKPFIMPHSMADKERLRIVLKGVSEGFCQLVNTETEGEQLLAFLPMPVLDGRRPRQLQSRGQALFDLRDAIQRLFHHKHGHSDKQCKDLKGVAVASLLLLARCRDSFSLSELCEQGCSGTGLDQVLMGGPDVMLHTVDRFPLHPGKEVTAADVQMYIDLLTTSGAPGLIIQVECRCNMPSDFYGVFQTSGGGFAGFRVQCKDWFLDTVYNKAVGGPVDVVQKWCAHDHLFPAQVVLSDGTTVPFASLLFTSNPLQQQVQLQEHEGIISIAAMRTWLPTAAHALQTLTHLWEIFGWYRQSTTNNNNQRSHC